jgi:hypothetical protein
MKQRRPREIENIDDLLDEINRFSEDEVEGSALTEGYEGYDGPLQTDDMLTDDMINTDDMIGFPE